MQYKTLIFMSNVIFFLKIGQTLRSKGLVIAEGSCHKEYQSSSSHCTKIISKVKVLKELLELKGQGHRVKN